MQLEDLISGLDITNATPGVDLASIRVCDVTEDSRTAVPGSLFIARPGTRDQGMRYIDPAIQCGAVAVLTENDSVGHIELPMRSKVALLGCDDPVRVTAQIAERFYAHPASKLICAGVTGTNGKTTIAHLTHQLVEGGGVRCGLIGTVEIDDGRERSKASMTTPPALELSRTLATMHEHGCKAVVMEVSSHALDQHRTGAVAFDASAFTNLTGDHLDYHLTLDHYQASKARLFESLTESALAAINIEDEHAERMIDACPRSIQIVRCGCDERCDAWVRIEDESIGGTQITMRTPLGSYNAKVPIFGAYNAMNILQSVLMAHEILTRAGVPEADQHDAITRTLPLLKLPTGRMEHCEALGDNLTVLVDFAHTDDALRSALSGVKRVLPDGAKLWCIFGCGGNRDQTKRPRMGQAVAQHADHIIVTSDNPRTESPSAIIDQVLSGIDPDRRAAVRVQADRATAIHDAILDAQPGDVIVIAGKGHETEQILPNGRGGTRTIRFDDRAYAQLALRERRMRFPGVDVPRAGAS
ncbi:MAG: UDP-N-acetylmuramoyl-L-alanyl-D-glutamate--2,6-diaminopimelate ligase [Phycisphaerales bacterium JB052]